MANFDDEINAQLASTDEAIRTLGELAADAVAKLRERGLTDLEIETYLKNNDGGAE